MVTLDKVLELCEKRARIVIAKKAIWKEADENFNQAWRVLMKKRLQKSINAIDAELEKLSGFEEVEPFEE